ncbi:MAG: geranylgeranyl reductase family protein [Deltaproteobacteria bacterium]|nr:geranylgeranyl reductase family protein [Deltaproteobacteria bacterium]
MLNASRPQFDAIVIGAGPAGSTAAYLLAKSGFHVLVLDKQDFPRDKLCGGLLTRKTVLLLEDLFQTSLDYLTSFQVIAHQSARYGVNLRDWTCFRGKLEYPFHFVDRSVYDAFWLQMACKAGAEFRSGEKVISLTPSSSSVITDTGNQYSGRYIIGADGAPSRLRRLLVAGGYIKGNNNPGLATTLEVMVSASRAPALPDYPLIYFGNIPWGYAWCFPRRDLRILGICGLNQKSGTSLKRAMARFLQTVNVSPDSIGALKSHALPYGNFLNQPGAEKVLLVGDACGLADPLLGEGIYYAHKSGQLAALAAIQSYRYSQNAFTLYRHYLSETIIPELKFVRIVRSIIFSLPGSWPGRALSFLLKISPRKCEETLQGQRSYRWLRPVTTASRK